MRGETARMFLHSCLYRGVSGSACGLFIRIFSKESYIWATWWAGGKDWKRFVMLPAIHTLLFIVVSGQKIETMDIIPVYIWTAGLQPTICLKNLELDLQLPWDYSTRPDRDEMSVLEFCFCIFSAFFLCFFQRFLMLLFHCKHCLDDLFVRVWPLRVRLQLFQLQRVFFFLACFFYYSTNSLTTSKSYKFYALR